MADKFVDSQRQNGLPARGHESSGVNTRTRTITFETAVADAAADIRRLFNVGAHEIPVDCKIINDAITGATDIDLGLYRPSAPDGSVVGAVVDADALLDGANIAAGVAWASATNGLAALGVEEQGVRSFREIANDVSADDAIGNVIKDSYDVALTFNSDISSIGTITVILETIDQQ